MASDREPGPVIERPDQHAAGAADELYCWMPGNADRECDGSCVAHDASYADDQLRDPCKFLNATRSMAKSVAVLVGQLQKRAEIAARQAQVDRQPKPPDVR